MRFFELNTFCKSEMEYKIGVNDQCGSLKM